MVEDDVARAVGGRAGESDGRGGDDTQSAARRHTEIVMMAGAWLTCAEQRAQQSTVVRLEADRDRPEDEEL